MVPTRNSFTNFFPGAGFIRGFATVGASPTVTLLAGTSSDQANVSITRGGVGVYTIAVKGLEGTAGVALGTGTSTLSGVLLACSTGTYSSGTMSMQFGSQLHDGSYSDSNFNFEIWAY